MYLKIHEAQGKRVIALCDKELIGNEIVEGEKILDLKLYASFYKGELVEESDVIEALADFDSINIVGSRSVELCIKIKKGSKDDVKYINNIPMLQVYKV